MLKYFFLQIFAVFIFSIYSNPLGAAIHSFGADGKEFIVNPSTSWKESDVKVPFHLKLIHENGRQECYLRFSILNANFNKDDLTYEVIESVEALYGKGFSAKPNFIFGYFHATDNFVVLHFGWKSEGKVESIMITGDNTFGNPHCARYLLSIHKRDIANFDISNLFAEDIEDLQNIVGCTAFLE